MKSKMAAPGKCRSENGDNQSSYVVGTKKSPRYSGSCFLYSKTNFLPSRGDGFVVTSPSNTGQFAFCFYKKNVWPVVFKLNSS